MARIYISSTYADLVECRELAYRALRQLGHDVIAMEDYVASDQRPLEKCLADVRRCELYVGILAWRYGFIPKQANKGKKSITELEFREAQRAGLKCLFFLHEETAAWPPAFVERGTGSKAIRKLRSEVSRDHLVSFFTDSENLARLVSVAVANWQSDRSRSGDANHPEVQIAQMLAEMAALRKDLQSMARAARVGDTMDQGVSGASLPKQDPAVAMGSSSLAVPQAASQAEGAGPGKPDPRQIAIDIASLMSIPRGSTLHKLPITAPIQLLVGRALGELIGGKSPEVFSEAFSGPLHRMREAFWKRFGVRLPGLVVNVEPGIPPMSYIVSIREVPMVAGQLNPDERFSPNPPAKFEKLSMSVRPGPHPESGKPGSWIKRRHWAEVLRSDLELWELLEYPVIHLGFVERRNVSAIFTAMDACALLVDIDLDLAKKVQNGPGFSSLRQVLSVLLEEEVPILPLRQITEIFLRMSAEAAHVLEIVEQVRLLPELRPLLNGNGTDAEFFVLGQDILAQVERGVSMGQSETAWLALLPETNTSIAKAIETAVRSSDNAVLVVEDSKLRRFVRKIADLVSPMPVLARAELQPKLARRAMKKITLSGRA